MTETSTEKGTFNRNRLPLEIAIGVLTVPTLIALVGAKALAEATRDLGRWSEEVFRGDRLPPLNPPSLPPSDT